MEEKKKLKRLVIDIDERLHIEIKTTAAKHVIPMKTWALRVILDQLHKEKSYE